MQIELPVLLPLPLGEGWGEGPTASVSIAALGLALLIDRCLGEPPARWHPVAWMGAYLGATGGFVAPREGQAAGRRFKPFIAGTLAWWAGAAMVLIAAWALRWHLAHLPAWLAAMLLALALKPLFAWRMLQGEVLAVEAALGTSLAAGRARLAQLVSRDVDTLDEGEVRESAIESLAENLNDSVVAPIFWFVIAGLPGAALYRFANTADAMWGYRGPRHGREWEWAGKWAARADDVLSWLPARLTALLLWCLAGVRHKGGLRSIRHEAAHTPSPNSGWPMAAMALLLGVRLGKPGVYVLNAAGRAPLPRDLQRAAAWGSKLVLVLAVCASAVICIPVLASQSSFVAKEYRWF